MKLWGCKRQKCKTSQCTLVIMRAGMPLSSIFSPQLFLWSHSLVYRWCAVVALGSLTVCSLSRVWLTTGSINLILIPLTFVTMVMKWSDVHCLRVNMSVNRPSLICMTDQQQQVHYSLYQHMVKDMLLILTLDMSQHDNMTHGCSKTAPLCRTLFWLLHLHWIIMNIFVDT